MDHYEVFHDILVNLFQEIMDIEGKALITSEFKDISVNDIDVYKRQIEKMIWNCLRTVLYHLFLVGEKNG